MFISRKKLSEIQSRLCALENSAEKADSRKNIQDGAGSNLTAALLDEWQNGERKKEVATSQSGRSGQWKR